MLPMIAPTVSVSCPKTKTSYFISIQQKRNSNFIQTSAVKVSSDMNLLSSHFQKHLDLVSIHLQDISFKRTALLILAFMKRAPIGNISYMIGPRALEEAVIGSECPLVKPNRVLHSEGVKFIQ